MSNNNSNSNTTNNNNNSNGLDLTLNTYDDPIPDLYEDNSPYSNGRRSKLEKMMVPSYGGRRRPITKLPDNVPFLYPSNTYQLSYMTRFMYVPYFVVLHALSLMSQIFTVVLPLKMSEPFAAFVTQIREEDEALEEMPIMQGRMRSALKKSDNKQKELKSKVENLKLRIQRIEQRRERRRIRMERMEAEKKQAETKDQGLQKANVVHPTPSPAQKKAD